VAEGGRIPRAILRVRERNPTAPPPAKIGLSECVALGNRQRNAIEEIAEVIADKHHDAEPLCDLETTRPLVRTPTRLLLLEQYRIDAIGLDNRHADRFEIAPCCGLARCITIGDVDRRDALCDDAKQELAGTEVVLFMKGTPQMPMCGFSGQVVQILDYLGVAYKGVNVLANEEIRQGVKEFSNWPTIPQLYVKGEFIGGADIVKEMFAAGELKLLMTEQGVLAA
jgi:monothiol glutaredoxin